MENDARSEVSFRYSIALPSSQRACSNLLMSRDLLSSLPVDLLTDVILPLLDCRALTSLEATCVAWRDFLNSEECSIVWRDKVQRHFNFPATATGRRTGFKQLYARLVGGESAFVWGKPGSSNSHRAHSKVTL